MFIRGWKPLLRTYSKMFIRFYGHLVAPNQSRGCVASFGSGGTSIGLSGGIFGAPLFIVLSAKDIHFASSGYRL